ncbi:hypothetical protein ACSBR1_028288 [Camellia fascicularis]
MDSVFGPGKDVADEKPASNPLALATYDWIQESGVPALDRMADVKVEGVTVGQADEGGDMFNSAIQSKDDMESLLSQMHDLSFMLKSNLSVPSK